MTKKTYTGWRELGYKCKQTEYTEPTKLLGDDGELLVKGGWARHNIFDYDRTKSQPQLRRKEWDFYQISNGKYMVQISIANISIGGYAAACLVDLTNPNNRKPVLNAMTLWLGGKNKIVLPKRGDEPNVFEFQKGDFSLKFDTRETSRTLTFMGKANGKKVECHFDMDIMKNLENITTVLPFDNNFTRYFMTTKQNCMPCEGTLTWGENTFSFSKDDTFCCLDWGRVNTPYKLVWYWGNGSAYVDGDDGKKHLFGFEITWGIGNDMNATETCLFWDGKAHKIGSVDVEFFPKPDKFMSPWHFESDDGRFDLTMTPFYDNHADTNVLNMVRMHSHQVHGLWNGTVVLDDGKKIEIKNMYAFCEYVENKW